MRDFDSFIKEIDAVLCPDKSFDILKRELTVAQRRAYLYFIDGFIKDEVFEKMLEYLFKQTPDTMRGITDMREFSKDKMPYVEVDYTDDPHIAATMVLSGPAVLIVDGINGALIVDTRTYPVRSIEEPQKDKSLRGSRDGFVETLIINTAMIRRRIRTEKLRMEYVQVGSESKVDMAISYIEGLADQKTLQILRKRLKNLKIKSISMTQQALVEALLPNNFLNPYPKFRFTERPDYASACILSGRIVLAMDNSPAVMVLPDSFADFFREIDDYYFLPVVGSYTRIIRGLVSVLTVIATPLYLLASNDPHYLPEWLSFLSVKEQGLVPLFVQFLLLEIIVDGLRLASINTPDSLSNSLGIIGGLLLSEFAINVGWFSAEAILFMAFVTIAGFSQPSFEMGYAMKFERIALLVLVELLGLWGFLGGIVLFTVAKCSIKTLSGRSYLYPVIPFHPKAFIRLFCRPGIGDKH